MECDGDGLQPNSRVQSQITEVLADRGIVTQEAPSTSAAPEARQLGYLSLFGPNPKAQQEAISRAKVGILGVGGVGGVVAQHLVGAGVRNLTLVDHDVVELSNLNRQFLLRHTDRGRPKIDVVRDSLHGLRDGLSIDCHRVAVGCGADLPFDNSMDLLVLAADRPTDIETVCWAWCEGAGVPMTTAGIGLDSGYWGPTLVPGSGCLDCWMESRAALLTAEQAESFSTRLDPTPWSFGPSNTVVSALLAHECIKFLATGDTSTMNTRHFIAFDRLAITSISSAPTSACSAHAGKGVS